MTQQNSQPDLADRELLRTNAGQRVSYSREIGEATITHTIFGKAKVRIARKYDNLRRALWLVAVVAVAGIGWQAWRLSQPLEAQLSADSIPVVNDRTTERLTDAPDAAATPAEAALASSQPVAAAAALPASAVAPGSQQSVVAQGVPHAAAVAQRQQMPRPASSAAAAHPLARPQPPRPFLQQPVGAAPAATAPHVIQPPIHQFASHTAAAPTPVIPARGSTPAAAPTVATPPVASAPAPVN